MVSIDRMVIVYTTPTCPDCRALKAWLSQRGITYEERGRTLMPNGCAKSGRRDTLHTPGYIVVFKHAVECSHDTGIAVLRNNALVRAVMVRTSHIPAVFCLPNTSLTNAHRFGSCEPSR